MTSSIHEQTCPHCRQCNKIAGIFRPCKVEGVSKQKLYCGFCGKDYTPNLKLGMTEGK